MAGMLYEAESIICVQEAVTDMNGDPAQGTSIFGSVWRY